MSLSTDTMETILEETDLFQGIMSQGILLNEYNTDHFPIATIQAGAPIEIFVKGADGVYLDLNESYLTVQAKITKADGGNPDAHTVGPINLPLHSMFKEVPVQLNGKDVGDPNSLYPYRAYLETALSYSEEVQKTRLLSEGWVKDLAGHMDVANPAGANTGLAAREDSWDEGATVELVGRPHVDVFQQNRLIPPGVDLHMKLVPASDAFFIMSNVNNNNFKLVIQNVMLTVHKKELTSEADLAHRELNRERSMKLPYTRVQMKTLSISANLTSFSVDNLFSGALPDRVIIGFVDDRDFAGAYGRNPFNFQRFNVSNIQFKRNGTPVPREGYKQTFGDSKYMRSYLTFQDQLGGINGDKCAALTPNEWANGYTLYAFKITDGPIGSGTTSPR